MALCANPERTTILAKLPDQVQTGGPGAASGEPRASGGAAAGGSRRTEGGGTVDDGAAAAPEDRGKHPRVYIPVPESPPSPSAVAVFPVLEPRLVQIGPDPAPGERVAAPPSPRRKRRRVDSGSALAGPEPPTGAPEAREAPAPALAPEPSRPAEPGQAGAVMEAGTAEAAAVPRK
ncbi:vegetative cell wall protein gp1-like [Phragmites australis]|uniref:vegetative cell wall protein gp1-like n=1 Tax=Phragmites australis TaxID=29695 RepID=UPI002D783E1F|nr:vegetative cell wall protein gp1-like [Phragmites australis]